jgi:hypothetical protein
MENQQMMPLSLLGLLVLAVVIGFGVYFLLSNLTIKSYTYEKDEAGDEVVKDNQNDTTQEK